MGENPKASQEQQAATESELGSGNEDRRTCCEGRQGAVGSEADAWHEEVAAAAEHKECMHA